MRYSLVLTLVLTSSLSAYENEAKHAFEEGRLLFFKGDFPAATTLLEKAVAANPSKVSYKLLLAKAHRFAGEPAKAIEVLEQIRRQQPDHVQAGLALAELLSPSKEPDRVIRVLRPLLKFQRDYPLYHLLAEAYSQKGDLERAREHFEQALQFNDRNAGDHHQLGRIYLAQKRLARSARAFEKAQDLGFSTPTFHFELAGVYFGMHNYLGKLETMEVIDGKLGEIIRGRLLVDAVPGVPHRFYTAGPRSAIHQLAKAKSDDIDPIRTAFLEANIWLGARRFAKAEAIYTTLEKQIPKEEVGTYWYHRAQTSLGFLDLEQYIARLRLAIEANPQAYGPALNGALIRVANLYQQQGDLDRSIAYLGQAVERNPLSSRLHLALGDGYWLQDKRDDALKQYKMVLELEPEFPFRVQLLNRIRGQEDSPTAIASGVTPRRRPMPRVGSQLAKVLCPVTGQPVNANVTLDHSGGKVFFSTADARTRFQKARQQFETKANFQLFQTKQASATVCPLTGRRLNPTISIDVGEVEVPLCCKGCQRRVKREKLADQLELLFAGETFRKHFKVEASLDSQ